MPEPSKNREDYLKEREAFGDRGLEQKLNLTIPEQEKEERKSTFINDLSLHLEELRNRVIISVAMVLVSVVACFYFSGEIIKFLQAAAPPTAKFFQLTPGELFSSSLRVALFAGLSLSLPIVLSQIALFVSPGLKENERQLLKPIMLFAPFLFYAGIAFAYYLVLPPLINFLFHFREGVVEERYGLSHFLNLEMSILGLCGVCFQLPILLLVLSYTGLIKSQQLMSVWRYAILSAFIIAAILTPTPDPITMSIVASALLSLYFGTVLLLKLLKR